MGEPLKPTDTTSSPASPILTAAGALAVFLAVYFWLRDRPAPDGGIADARRLRWEDVAYEDKHGKAHLQEWRLRDIQRQHDELEDSEQYVLLATEDGLYECFYCPTQTCFLRKGMVWKYGVTTKHMGGRYPGNQLINNRLNYMVQLRGTYQQCRAEEIRKIVFYPLHPDNLGRPLHERLARPPGNKDDR
jgi:hypothetical protein